MRKCLALAAASTLALGISAVGMAVVPDNALASAGTKTVLNWQGDSSYSKTKTIADITGDKRPDKVRFAIKATRYGTESLTIYVNGKKAYKTKEGNGGFVCKVQRLELANGKPFLFVEYTGDNADGVYGILDYKSGKLKKLLTCRVANGIRHPYIGKVKVSGNTLNVTYENQPYALGMCQFTYSYKYKGGKLKATSSITTRLAYQPKCGSSGRITKWVRSTLTLNGKTPMYKSPSTKSKKVTFGKGTKVKLEAVKNVSKRLWFKAKIKKTGKSYWIKNPSKYLLSNEYPRGTYFKEKFQAG